MKMEQKQIILNIDIKVATPSLLRNEREITKGFYRSYMTTNGWVKILAATEDAAELPSQFVLDKSTFPEDYPIKDWAGGEFECVLDIENLRENCKLISKTKIGENTEFFYSTAYNDKVMSAKIQTLEAKK